MLVMLAAALVGDLILLPALLAGPAGRWFKPRVESGGVSPDQVARVGNDSPTGCEEVETTPVRSAAAAAREDEEDRAIPHLKVHFPTDRADPPHRRQRQIKNVFGPRACETKTLDFWQ